MNHSVIDLNSGRSYDFNLGRIPDAVVKMLRSPPPGASIVNVSRELAGNAIFVSYIVLQMEKDKTVRSEYLAGVHHPDIIEPLIAELYKHCTPVERTDSNARP